MKRNRLLIFVAATILAVGCQQEIPELTPPQVTGEPGNADFTKFISMGNSLTAGFQAGALFTEGQNNSYPSIMAKQFAYVSDNDPFDQPSINSVNGYYSTGPGGLLLGRLILFDSDGTGPKGPSPTPAGFPGVPAPYNTADLPAAFEGDKTALNNFGVPGILLGQALIPETGNPSHPAFNPLWARFASQPGVKSILEDAIAQQPTFFSFWLGNNDVLGYATSGGSGAIPMTEIATFQGAYTTAINALLAVSENTKGVIANIPDVTTIPFFLTVRYNAIPLDEATAGAVNQGFGEFNYLLTEVQKDENSALRNAFGLTSEDLELRKVSFAASPNNRILIYDESLTDLGPLFDYLKDVAGMLTAEQREKLRPYQQSRQATSTDLITLSAGSVLGTTVGGNPLAVNGVSVPLADQYVLIPTEIQEIKARTTAFNNIIANIASGSNNRIALVDINTAFTNLVNGTTTTVDGFSVNPSFAPPWGLFSEDGIHPNNRGSAYLAKLFIKAINEKFGSTVPDVNITQYKSTPLPVSPQ